MTPIFLDSEAARLYSLGERQGGEDGAFLIQMAQRLERQCEQITTLQSLTGYDFADGVMEGERRVMGRANIPPPPAPQNLQELLKSKEFKAAMAALPVKKIPKGKSAYDPVTGKLKEPKPAKVKDYGIEISDDDMKELGL